MQNAVQRYEPPNEQTQQRSIPANLDAERAVLGSILIDPDAIIKVANFLQPADFFSERNGWLYAAMITLNQRGEPIDFVTVTEELDRRKQLTEVRGPAFITDMIAGAPTALYVEHYARIVERTAVLRRLIGAAGKISEIAYNEELELDEAIEQAETQLFAVSAGRQGKQLSHIGNGLQGLLAGIAGRMDNPEIGGVTVVPTGFFFLDKMLGGFQSEDLIILAARPGMGKTGMALSVALNATRLKKSKIAFFSLEMSAEQQTLRLLSMMTGIDNHRMRLGVLEDYEWDIVVAAANELTQSDLYFDDSPAQTITDIRVKSRRLQAEAGVDLIIIDYLQLLSGRGGDRNENRQQEISQISRSLKSLARELKVPIVALSQLSRAVESRADKRPMLSDLRESGSLEQDSDVVMFIYREDYYLEDSDRQNIADILVAKHRHGETGTVSLFFRKQLTQFRDLEIMRTDLEY